MNLPTNPVALGSAAQASETSVAPASVESVVAERAAVERALGDGKPEEALALLAHMREARPDDADSLMWTMEALRQAHGAEAALAAIGGTDAAASALAAAMPTVALTLHEQGHELLEARLLLARQSEIIDRLMYGIHRIQGISDYLGGRVESLEAQARTAAIAQGDDAGAKLVASCRALRVLYVSGDPNSPSHDYRVAGYIEALAAQGIEAEWLPAHEPEKILAALPRVSLVVFFRVALRPNLEPALAACRLQGIPTVFDVDDYVFEPRIADARYIDGIRYVPPKDLELYHWGVKAYRRMLLSVDAVTVTTEFLADRVRELGRRAHVLPNGFDDDKLEFSRVAAQRRAAEAPDGLLRIGYASGSKTHQRDFALCAGAVAEVLRRRPEVRLVLFRHPWSGITTLDVAEFPALQGLDSQIEWRDLVPLELLPEELARFDVNLAPLEVGNAFCEAKSELKFFEAALVGVCTVASPTGPFSGAIRHGETGYLAATTEEWQDAIERLLGDAAARRSMALLAQEAVLSAFGPASIGAHAATIYRGILTLSHAARGFADHSLAIGMLLPKLTAGSGGHAKAIALMRGLAELGHRVRLHFTEASPDYHSHAAIRDQFALPASVIISEGEVAFPPLDVLIATFWKTAHLIAERSDLALVPAYLMQDYEPMFYAMSDDFIGAEQSYSLGLRNISYGPWIKSQIEKRHGASADSIPFFIDQSLFRPGPEQRNPDKLVVFYRPEMARRLFALTMRGIELFLQKTERAVEVVMFGSWAEGSVPFEHSNLRVISPPEMAVLFREGAAGIAISSTNPSMVPLEMLACGMPVIDIAYGDNAVNYGGCEGVRLATPTPEGLAEAIADVMGDAALRRRMGNAAIRFGRALPSEFEVVDQLSALLGTYVAEAYSGEDGSVVPQRRPTKALGTDQ
jgi:glycosyltransferase involved in cell wall biosynthesis